MTNVFIKVPERGDIVVKTLATKEVKYIKLSTFSLADLSTTLYEIVGVVYYREGNNVGVVYKTNASKTWCSRYSHKLTGYTLDGTERTGVISFRESSSATANTDLTITYTATTKAELCAQLNRAFQDDNRTTLLQGWYAEVVGEGDDSYINISYDYMFYQQAQYNTGKSGFTLTANTLPDVKALANIRRKHGGKGGEGAVTNLARAIAKWTADQTAGTYNPSSKLTSIKTSYPVCLPAYLGTSANVSGDMCEILRAKYGEGEEGWKKYLKAQMTLYPTDYGNAGQHDGKARTAVLAAKTYSSTAKSNEPLCKAASYCYNISSNTVNVGEFWLPTVEEVAKILNGVEYGTSSSRTADVLNKALYQIGGTAISNGAGLWSCCRYSAGVAWLANGSGGYFGSYVMCYSYGCVPVSLYKVA